MTVLTTQLSVIRSKWLLLWMAIICLGLVRPVSGGDIGAGDTLITTKAGGLYARDDNGLRLLYPRLHESLSAVSSAIAVGDDSTIYRMNGSFLRAIDVFGKRVRTIGTTGFSQALAFSNPAREVLLVDSANNAITAFATTGSSRILSRDGLLDVPVAVATTSDGESFVLNQTGEIIRVGVEGQQGSLATTTRSPYVLTNDNDYLYAIGSAIERIQIDTGAITDVPVSQSFSRLRVSSAAILSTGDLLAVAGQSAFTLNPDTGTVSLICCFIGDLQVAGTPSGDALLVESRSSDTIIHYYDANDNTATALLNTRGALSGEVQVAADGALFGLTGATMVRYRPALGALQTIYSLTESGGSFDIGADGLHYVYESDRWVRRYNPATGAAEDLFQVPNAGLGVKGVAVAPTGDVYVAAEGIGDGSSSGEILYWDSASDDLGILGHGACQEDPGLCSVAGITRTGDGNILASDFTDGRLALFDPSSRAFIRNFDGPSRAGRLAAETAQTSLAVTKRNPFLRNTEDGVYRLHHDTGRLDFLFFAPTDINGLASAVAGSSSPLVAAVLPGSRAVAIGQSATAFSTLINTGATTLSNCRISSIDEDLRSLTYFKTDPGTNNIVGGANESAMIGAGGIQTFLLEIASDSEIRSRSIPLLFECDEAPPVASLQGINTLLFSSAAESVPDVIALAATPAPNDGIVRVSGSNAFSVATFNVGASGAVKAIAESSVGNVVVSICQTNPTSGQCTIPLVPTTGAVSTNIDTNETGTFSVFVTAPEPVGLDPVQNRIVVRFFDSSGLTRGSTSVAVVAE